MVRDLGAKRSLLLLTVGFILGAALLGVPWLQHIGAFDPIPYRVLPGSIKWSRSGSFVDYRAQFLKDECAYQTLIVRGIYFGEVDPRPIPWEDIHGGQGDREEGQQGLAIRIGPLQLPFEALEVRTRHICDGRKVDRLFDRIELQ